MGKERTSTVVYRMVLTEYEQGWGQRPDGVVYSTEREPLENFAKELLQSDNDHSCFTRASSITQCLVTDELYKKIVDSPLKVVCTDRNEHSGVIGIVTPV